MIKDKTLIHKLFKVLVPRYLNYTTSFTSMHLLPSMKIDWSNPEEKQTVTQKVIIELKGELYNNFYFLFNFFCCRESVSTYYRI